MKWIVLFYKNDFDILEDYIFLWAKHQSLQWSWNQVCCTVVVGVSGWEGLNSDSIVTYKLDNLERIWSGFCVGLCFLTARDWRMAGLSDSGINLETHLMSKCVQGSCACLKVAWMCSGLAQCVLIHMTLVMTLCMCRKWNSSERIPVALDLVAGHTVALSQHGEASLFN